MGLPLLAIIRRWSTSGITPGNHSVHCHEYGAGRRSLLQPTKLYVNSVLQSLFDAFSQNAFHFSLILSHLTN